MGNDKDLKCQSCNSMHIQGTIEPYGDTSVLVVRCYDCSSAEIIWDKLTSKSLGIKILNVLGRRLIKRVMSWIAQRIRDRRIRRRWRR